MTNTSLICYQIQSHFNYFPHGYYSMSLTLTANHILRGVPTSSPWATINYYFTSEVIEKFIRKMAVYPGKFQGHSSSVFLNGQNFWNKFVTETETNREGPRLQRGEEHPHTSPTPFCVCWSNIFRSEQFLMAQLAESYRENITTYWR